jgi:hypothetical protein
MSKADTVGKTEKEVEAQSVYIDAGRSPDLRRRKGGGGMESGRAGHRPGRTGPGGSCQGQSSPTFRAHQRPTSPSITTYHQHGPACRPIERRAVAARLQLRNAKSLTACQTNCQARCDICSMNQYHLHGSKSRHVASC